MLADLQEDYDSLRERYSARRDQKTIVPLATARADRTPIDWSDYKPPVPQQLAEGGAQVRVFDDYPLAELRPYIDWQPFFNAWELKGRYPDILNNPASGEAARKLWEDGQAMLDTLIEERWLKASGVVGLFRRR